MPSWKQPLLASCLGLAVAGGLVAVAEHRAREFERSNGMVFPWHEPGRKFALVPKDELSPLNSAGFNDREFEEARTPGRTRVVVLGDSVTYGSGVPTAEVYPRVAEGLLRERGQDLEIYNLAIYGYDVEQVAATLRHVGWRYQPDLVVYAAFTNDHIPTRLLRVGSEGLPVFVGVELEEELAVLSPELSVAAARTSALARRFLGARVARALAASREAGSGRGAGQPGDESWFQEHLEAMAADAADRGVPLVVYGLGPHVLAGGEATCEVEGRGELFCAQQRLEVDRLHQAAHDAGLPFLSALPFYEAAPQTSFYRDEVDDPHHPNAAGHEVLAAGLARLVEDWQAGALELSAPAPRAEQRSTRPPKKQGRHLEDGARESRPKKSSRDHPPPSRARDG